MKLELPGVTSKTPLPETLRKAFAESRQKLGREPKFVTVNLKNDSGDHWHIQFVFN